MKIRAIVEIDVEFYTDGERAVDLNLLMIQNAIENKIVSEGLSDLLIEEISTAAGRLIQNISVNVKVGE
ncbi:MAG: hypothetical protein AN484_28485 [Aphanizomenon flos-aquae WA102]|jgi:hypothetical protein|uniref:Uncharacterized protein n=1 Tax=Aphanizomenon flos-aquae WA102 TaxID=1710896 RepID=A0A1B7W4A4_APHFL|nr:MAG: hypothetical protein AN484_28485 [Aphanizomenon flos-aquae WA102]